MPFFGFGAFSGLGKSLNKRSLHVGLAMSLRYSVPQAANPRSFYDSQLYMYQRFNFSRSKTLASANYVAHHNSSTKFRKQSSTRHIFICVVALHNLTITMGFTREEPQKVIIFDWDDTICPSSFFDRQQMEKMDQLPESVSPSSCVYRIHALELRGSTRNGFNLHA